MIETINAIYKNGIFKPLGVINISDGKTVKLIIESAEVEQPQNILELAGSVYDGLSDNEIDAIEEIAFNREDMFGNS